MTDAEGAVEFEWRAGSCNLRIVVPGVGYGVTGIFELPVGGVARPAAPPLFPFGRIEGDIPASVLRPDIHVPLDRENHFEPLLFGRYSESNKTGHFEFRDVPCGGHWLDAEVRERPLGIEAFVWLAPGGAVGASPLSAGGKRLRPPVGQGHADPVRGRHDQQRKRTADFRGRGGRSRHGSARLQDGADHCTYGIG